MCEFDNQVRRGAENGGNVLINLLCVSGSAVSFDVDKHGINPKNKQ